MAARNPNPRMNPHQEKWVVTATNVRLYLNTVRRNFRGGTRYQTIMTKDRRWKLAARSIKTMAKLRLRE